MMILEWFGAFVSIAMILGSLYVKGVEDGAMYARSKRKTYLRKA